MQVVTTIGLDIAKSVFQVHGVDAHGRVVVRRQLKRRYVLPFFKKLSPCLVGIEACATSHHWSRELQALGHTVRLMPPAYVKPYLKRQKNDAADAEAICEAVARPNMRFVETKTAEQQSCLMLHRTRHLFVRQQNAVINSIRAHLAELGIVAPVGRNGVDRDGTFPPGSGWFPNKTRAEARRSSVGSPSAAIVICAACLRPARWRSFATRRSTAPSTGHGSPHCWRGGQPRWRPLRSPTRSPAWHGP
jgi:transposase